MNADLIEGCGDAARGVLKAYRGGWEPVLLVGIDWADTEHVYCLMDESGTTLATGTIARIHPLRDTLWQFAFASMRHCEWAKIYYDRARLRGKKHAEAVRMLGNVWLRIIIAMRRERRPYDESLFLKARSAHPSLALCS